MELAQLATSIGPHTPDEKLGQQGGRGGVEVKADGQRGGQPARQETKLQAGAPGELQ